MSCVVDPGITAGRGHHVNRRRQDADDKPIKYVVDTHYHYDHAFGNQVFGPDVTIIGHDTTRRRLNGPGSLEGTDVSDKWHGGDREPLHDAQEADLGSPGCPTARDPRAAARHPSAVRRRAGQDTADSSQRDVVARHDARRGTREIQIRFFGRAHTDGDIVVFLPKERMVATGDMITSAPVVHWRRVHRGMARDAGGVYFARLRHGVAGTRQRVQRQRSHSQPAGVLARLRSTGDGASQAGCLSGGSGEAYRSHEARRRYSRCQNPGVDVRGVDRMYDLAANPNAPVR